MLVVVDYGMGNLHSLMYALNRVDLKATVSADPEVIKNATALIIPGVGAFKDAIDLLDSSGLSLLIKEHAKKGTYILGICLGMQLLFEKSYEFGCFDGLGLIKGSIDKLNVDLKVPHMGWNSLVLKNKNDPILKYIKDGEYVYFVHSFYKPVDEFTIAYAEYETNVSGIVRSNNVYGMQFHPEKSSDVGERLLKGFKEMITS